MPDKILMETYDFAKELYNIGAAFYSRRCRKLVSGAPRLIELFLCVSRFAAQKKRILFVFRMWIFCAGGWLLVCEPESDFKEASGLKSVVFGFTQRWQAVLYFHHDYVFLNKSFVFKLPQRLFLSFEFHFFVVVSEFYSHLSLFFGAICFSCNHFWVSRFITSRA